MVARSWRPRYSEALKQVGVIGLCGGEESAQRIADRLGVYRPALYNWRNQLLGHDAPSSMKRRNTAPPVPER
jgi:transposase-like protein